MLKAACAIAVAALVSGCVTRPNVTISEPYDEAATLAQMGEGTNSIKGSALFRQQGGGVVTCAGFPVAVFPATPYSRARMTAIYGSPSGGLSPVVGAVEPVFNPDPPGYVKALRETRCDAQGFFRFDKMKSGEYYVISRILWMAGYARQGGVMSSLVTVKDGEVADVVLAR